MAKTDLRSTVSSTALADSDQLAKGTGKLGTDFTTDETEVALNTVWEMIKPLNEQVRHLHQMQDEMLKY